MRHLASKVGGPYAYTKEAWGAFAGFIIGWSLWLAEWISLVVFPVAFTRYLMFFIPNLGWLYQTIIKGLFVAFLVVTNIVGVKAAGETNDILTLIKPMPLILFSVIGLLYITQNLSVAASDYTPFSPLGFSDFGKALIIIFWAYAGFEISTIPADEINDPSKTIPKAIAIGILIVTIFYLATNIVLVGVRPWTLLANDNAPLASATEAVVNMNPTLALVAGLIVGGGALISVAGSDESGMIGTARLGYALAVDGLFPSVFARLHPKFETPYLSIIIQAVTALVVSILGEMSMLVATSVLFMAIAYPATSLSFFKLKRKFNKSGSIYKGGLLIAFLGAISSLYLISQCSIEQFSIGAILLFIGVFIYAKFTPKKELTDLKIAFFSKEAVLERTYRQEQKFLAHLLSHIKNAYRRATGKKHA